MPKQVSFQSLFQQHDVSDNAYAATGKINDLAYKLALAIHRYVPTDAQQVAIQKIHEAVLGAHAAISVGEAEGFEVPGLPTRTVRNKRA